MALFTLFDFPVLTDWDRDPLDVRPEHLLRECPGKLLRAPDDQQPPNTATHAAQQDFRRERAWWSPFSAVRVQRRGRGTEVGGRGIVENRARIKEFWASPRYPVG